MTDKPKLRKPKPRESDLKVMERLLVASIETLDRVNSEMAARVVCRLYSRYSKKEIEKAQDTV